MENINKIRVQGVDYTVGPVVDSKLSASSENPIQNKVVKSELDKKQDKLIQGENITIDPETNTISAIGGGGGGITDAPNDGKKYTRQNNSWVEETKVDTSTLATKDEVASTYQVKGDYATSDQLEGKQDSLESGVNIKTINGQSLLGTGNIEIVGTGEGIPDAPSDGKQYARKNGNWEEVSISGIDSKADKVTVESVSGSSIELKPNKFLKLNGVSSSITLTLAEEIPGIMNEYMFQFTSGSTPTEISLPGSVNWIGDHTIESNKTYILSIVSNLAVIGGA